MASPSQKTGKAAEDRACQLLQNQGLQLIARNWQNRQGEIDLIMQDHDHVVFVEVRTRKNDHFGSATESVTRKKRQKLISSSLHFLQTKGWYGQKNCRYDVVGIVGERLEWIKNAFDADDQ